VTKRSSSGARVVSGASSGAVAALLPALAGRVAYPKNVVFDRLLPFLRTAGRESSVRSRGG
jgi:hypothetical protein